jgi:Conjugative transposon protein TcpC
MFRGLNPGDGVSLSDYSDVIPLFGSAGSGPEVLDQEVVVRGSGVAAGRSWNGSGGRWLLWPLRVVLWATLLVIAYRGVTAIIFHQGSAPPAGGADTEGGTVAGQFPVMLAEAYAAEFGRVYLNFSPATQAQREQQLAAYLPPRVVAANPDLGWNGVGQLRLQSEQVAGIAVQDRQHAVVTLLATVNGELMELGVPVIASGGGVVVAGEPAWLPAPQAASPPAAASQGSDPVARGELMAELPAFFQAYADGDNAALARFEPRGVSLTGLGGTVAFDSIAELQVPPGGVTRHITVAVIWQLPEQASAGVTKLEMTYTVSVVERQIGKWYVNEISAATEAAGRPADPGRDLS